VAEAMWLGTAVLATAYSGVLDLVDDTCAALVPARIVAVRGGGEAYPDDARWADPDLDAAASAMRRLVDDPAWRAGIAAAARRRIAVQADRGAAAGRVEALLRR
jgi:glycosyltransferase involved in cell wall biosynthesis